MNKSEEHWMPGEGMEPDRNLVDMTDEEMDRAVKKTAEVMKEKEREQSRSGTSSSTYADTLVNQVLRDNPRLTREKARRMIEALG